MYRGSQRISNITNPFLPPQHLVTDDRFLPLTYFQPSEEEFIAQVIQELEDQQQQQQAQVQQTQQETNPASGAPESLFRANVLADIMSPAFNKSSSVSSHHNREGQRVAWIDCEMSGLDPEEHTVLELSCVITELNENLDLVAEHETMVIHHPEEVIQKFSPWCVENHGKTGLTARVRASDLQMRDAEDFLLSFLSKFTKKGVSMAGNSVYVDKMFLAKHMPKVNDHLHYRLIDVSTVSMLSTALNPRVHKHRPTKVKNHTARTDIYESIQELRYFNKNLFKVFRK